MATDLDPNEEDPGVLWAEIHRLRAAVQGPDGYATWQEAATAERVRRVAAEKALAATQAPAPVAGDVRELRKWLNEQPNRPVDRGALARLLHAVENAQPAGEIITDCDGEAVLGDEVSWRAGMPPAGTKLYTAPVQAPAVGAEADDKPKATAYEYELERLIHDFVRTALVGSPSEATLHHLDQLIDTVRHPTINRNLRSMRRQVTNPRPPCPPFASRPRLSQQPQQE